MTRHSLTKLTKGKAIGAQPGFCDTFNWMVDAWRRLTCRNGVRLNERGAALAIEADPAGLPPSSGGGSPLPAGYAEATVVTAIDYDASSGVLRAKTATALVKTATLSGWQTVVTFEEYTP